MLPGFPEFLMPIGRRLGIGSPFGYCEILISFTITPRVGERRKPAEKAWLPAKPKGCGADHPAARPFRRELSARLSRALGRQNCRSSDCAVREARASVTAILGVTVYHVRGRFSRPKTLFCDPFDDRDKMAMNPLGGSLRLRRYRRQWTRERSGLLANGHG